MVIIHIYMKGVDKWDGIAPLPAGTSISAVFSFVRFLNFYVNGELCWGIELTREGNHLNEHAERFETNDTYVDIPLKQWAILDFRHHSK
ncbi:26535_t:CDS:1, partial [Gigaspora margarita]